MAVKKLSVALDEEVVVRASSSAGRLGLSLSAWLNRAAENALAVESGLAAVLRGSGSMDRCPRASSATQTLCSLAP